MQATMENEERELKVPNPKSYSRIHLKKRRTYKRVTKWAFIILVFIAVLSWGLIYVEKSGVFFNKQVEESEVPIVDTKKAKTENDEIIEEGKSDEDIRYVTVGSAYIRTDPDIESEASSIASFGQAFLVEESSQKLFSEVEWLRITNKTTAQEGWISGKVLENLADEVNDEEVVDKIGYLGNYTELERVTSMIGETEGEEESFDHVEYNYVDDHVVGFTITVGGFSDQKLFDELGAPQIKRADKLLYHGATYDFIFTLLEDGMISKLTVNEN